MKNFSEATATRLDLLIGLHLSPIGRPSARIKINGKILLDDVVERDTHIVHTHDLLAPLDLSVELRDKTYSLDHETAIVVNKITVDGISIVPSMSHHFHYENDHGFTAPTCYLGFNGIWRLDTQQCFYRWWHQTTGQGWLLSPTA